MPKIRSKHTRRTKAQWVEILGRFDSSPLASREFCRREGLPLSSFQRWRRQLGSVDAAEGCHGRCNRAGQVRATGAHTYGANC